MIAINVSRLAAVQKRRLLLVASTLLYILINIYNYYYYLTPVWGYQGFPEFNSDRSMGPLISAGLSCIIFSAIYPRQITFYSRFVVWFLFFFVFVPSVIIVAMQGFPADAGYFLIACLTVSLYLIAFIPEGLANAKWRHAACYKNTLISIHNTLTSATRGFNSKFEFNLIIVFILFSAALLVFYANVIAVVAITDVYDQRDIVSEYSPNKTLAAYSLQWLIRVIAPLMIAIGIIHRRRFIKYLGFFGLLIGFFVTGSKFIVFLIPLMYAVHYFVLRKDKIVAEDIGKLLAGIMAAMLLLIEIYGEEVEGLVGLVLSQVVKRAFSINGMTLGSYYDFFVNNPNPFTFYSHLGPVSWLIDYPYGEFGIGQVVGHFQVGLYTYDMSAGFWSTDGIAAAGYFGLVLIGLILGVILAIFNRWSANTNLSLLCLSSLGCVWMLADTSVFRVLLSGGWPLHFLLVYFYGRRLQSIHNTMANMRANSLKTS
jgi:hypothetical protein